MLETCLEETCLDNVHNVRYAEAKEESQVDYCIYLYNLNHETRYAVVGFCISQNTLYLSCF